MNLQYGAEARPTQEHRDYRDALRVCFEVSQMLVDEMARPDDERVIDMAEKITFEHAPERAIDEAERITYDYGVQRPRALIGQAELLTKNTNPDAVVAKAESITYHYGVQMPQMVISQAERALERAWVDQEMKRRYSTTSQAESQTETHDQPASD